MAFKIRPFRAEDAARLVEILTENGQYSHPAVEGPDAMARAARSDATVFLVAVSHSGTPVGIARAIYDGTRAMIHLLSVARDAQRCGIGTALVVAVQSELRRRGAPTVSVTVTESSAPFWARLGFADLPVRLMLKDPI